MDRVDLYRDDAGEWRWRRWSSSDKVSESGEGYTHKADARAQAERLNPGVEIREPDED